MQGGVGGMGGCKGVGVGRMLESAFICRSVKRVVRIEWLLEALWHGLHDS